MSENAIELTNVCKTFKINDVSHKGLIRKKITKRALDNITLNIKKGEVFGIIGRNGSGKSTLLSIINKIMYPDSGSVVVDGEVASILELGMGFHQDLTGRENIYVKSELYGFSKEEIDKKIDMIIKYSELEEYIDEPVRTYSSGMSARLAFAVMVNVDSEIMLVDEVLSVGDTLFASKAISHFKKIAKSGKTVIFVSHSIELIRELCNRVAWIDKGKIVDIGESGRVCNHYDFEMNNNLDLLKNRAEGGDALAMFKLGCWYRDGNNVEKNTQKAKEFFKLSSAAGNSDAQVCYGDLLMLAGDSESMKTAMSYYRASAEKGNTIAKWKISTYHCAKINEKLYEDLLDTFEKTMTECQNPTLTYDYACYLEKIHSSAENYDKIIQVYQSISNLKSEACLRLGQIYLEGHFTQKNIPLAIKWLEKSHSMHNLQATVLLANLFSTGLEIEKDESKKIQYISEAADNGDFNSKYELGIIQQESCHKKSNNPTDYLEKYCIQHVEKELYLLSNLLRNTDCKKTIEYLEKLSQTGNAWAKLRLAQIYRENNQSDCIPKIAQLLEEASDSGLNQATGELIDLCSTRPGGEDKINALVNILEKRAQCGDTDAIFRIGMIYADGHAVKPNLDKAEKWLQISSNLGNAWAKLRLAQIYRENNQSDCIPKIAQLLEEASDSGLNQATGELIDLCSTRPGGEDKINALVNILEKRAQCGDTDAMIRLFLYYSDKKENDKSHTWALVLSKFGNDWALKQEKIRGNT